MVYMLNRYLLIKPGDFITDMVYVLIRLQCNYKMNNQKMNHTVYTLKMILLVLNMVYTLVEIFLMFNMV